MRAAALQVMQDSEVGKLLAGACQSNRDCAALGYATSLSGVNDANAAACVGGMCLACGGPGQPCCDGRQACRNYGGGQLACTIDDKLGTNTCDSPATAGL